MARRPWSTAACTARGCWAECSVAQEPPAQLWRVQIPVRHLCARDGKAGGRGDDSAAKMQASHFQITGTWRTPHVPGESACMCAFVAGWVDAVAGLSLTASNAVFPVLHHC